MITYERRIYVSSKKVSVILLIGSSRWNFFSQNNDLSPIIAVHDQFENHILDLSLIAFSLPENSAIV